MASSGSFSCTILILIELFTFLLIILAYVFCSTGARVATQNITGV